MHDPVKFDIDYEGRGLCGNPVYTTEIYDDYEKSLKDPIWTRRRWYQIIHFETEFPGPQWFVTRLNSDLHARLLEMGIRDYSLRAGDPGMFQRPYLEIYDRKLATLFRLSTDFPVCNGFPSRDD